MRTGRLLVLGLIGTALLTGAASGCGQSADSSPSAPAATADSEAKRAFGVLRRARRAEDEMGPAARGVTDEGSLGRHHNVDPAEARRVAPAARTKVWVAPGDGSICLLNLPSGADGAATSCTPVDDAENGEGVVTVSYSKDQVDIFGIVPDGVDTVTLELADGTTQRLRVRDNVYFASAAAPSKTITFEDPAGKRRVVDAGSFTG
jgi:hypothetical protein